MVKDVKLREELAELEHRQWMYWSRSIAKELEFCIDLLHRRMSQRAMYKLKDILVRWDKNWDAYDNLDEDTKSFDREWANRVLDVISEHYGKPEVECSSCMNLTSQAKKIKRVAK